MNVISDLLLQPVVERLGWALVHFLWQGLTIAALLRLLLGLLHRRSANARYLVACGGLLLMGLAPLLTFWWLGGADESAQPTMVPFEAVAQSVTGGSVDPLIVSSGSLPSLVERIDASLPFVVAGWLTVVCVLALRLFCGWIEVQRLYRTSTKIVGANWEKALERLACSLGLRRPVRLIQSSALETPAVIGWLRPTILMPAAVFANLTSSQLEAILAHELAHIRRHDYLVNLAQKIIETFLFYHPAVWWISRKIEEEREHSCDDLTVRVCGDRIVYAQALTALEEWRTASLQLALGARGGPLLKRIRRLLGMPADADRTGSWLAGSLLCAAILLLAVGPWAFGNAAETGTAENQAAGKRPVATEQATSPERTEEEGPPSATLQQEQVGIEGPKPQAETQEQAPKLHTRVFKVDPKKFLESLQQSFPGGASETRSPSELIRALATLGLEFPTAPVDDSRQNRLLNFRTGEVQAPRKAIYFNDRSGALLVRATLEDLEVIEQGIQILNVQPPQVVIESKFFWVADDQEKLLGLDWITRRDAQPDELPPDDRSRPNLEPTSQVAAILTKPQYRVLAQALEKGRMAVFAAPRVTTASGRQARIEVGGLCDLELVPTVLPDGRSVHVEVRVSVASSSLTSPGAEGEPGSVMHLKTTAQVWDGQTILLSKLSETDDSPKGRVVVVLTPTLIDPAGNRIHGE